MPAITDRLAERVKDRTSEPIPKWCAKLLSKYGKNQYSQNLYRIVWGWDRWAPRETPEGVVEFPKYVLETDWELNRWILEKWLYTQDAEPSGLFGYYELCHVIQTENKHFMQITPYYIELIVQLIEKGRDYSFEEKKNAILEQMAQADKAHEAKQDAILNEAFHEARLHIGMNPSCLDDVKMTHGIQNPRTGFGQFHSPDELRKSLRRI